MAYASINQTTVIKRDRFEDTLVKREVLWGLIRWDEVVSSKHKGTEIHIFSENDNKLYFNGKLVKS